MSRMLGRVAAGLGSTHLAWDLCSTSWDKGSRDYILSLPCPKVEHLPYESRGWVQESPLSVGQTWLEFSLWNKDLGLGLRSAGDLPLEGAYHSTCLGTRGRGSPVFLSTCTQSEASVSLNWGFRVRGGSKLCLKCHRISLLLRRFITFSSINVSSLAVCPLHNFLRL